jgi:hypothetical protein
VRTDKDRARLEKLRAQLRTALENTGHSPDSIRAHLGWTTRHREERLELAETARTLALGAVLDGKIKEDHAVLVSHVTRRSKAFQEFVDYAMDELGMTYEEAVDEWFSP